MKDIILKTKREYNNLNQALMDFGISNRSFKKYYFRDLILVNNEKVRHKAKIRENSEIKIILEDEKIGEYIKSDGLNVLYEDDMILAVEKESHLLTHESKNFSGLTLRDKIATYFSKNDIKSQVRFVNRLDMDTSGILIVAKNDIAQGYFQKEIESNSLIREYIAVVKGNLNKRKKVDMKIKYDDEISIKRKASIDEGLDAKTLFYPIYNFKDYAVIRARIISGRTHQIRVHLGTLGLTVVGDELYGEKSEYIDRQALHSYRTRGKTIYGKNIDILSPLPEDMIYLINEIIESELRNRR